MDNRKFESAASATPPTAPASPSSGYPTNGNPGTGTPATLPGEFWFHKIGEELRAIITDAGLTPSDSNLTQLLTAIRRQATESLFGMAKLATQAQTNAGSDDHTMVTPLKLKAGFAISLAANGYIVFPSFFSNLIIQWGAANFSTGGTANTFPLAFPNNVLSICFGNTGTAGLTTFISTTSNTLSAFTVKSSANTGNYFYLAIGN